MANKLFIVCPFSCLENFIRTHYGNDVFFLTYAGTVLGTHDFIYNSIVKHLIHQEKIKTIYLVNDTSCQFINSVITRKQLIGLTCEKVIEEIYIEHYLSVFKGLPLQEQQHKLAELNIKAQVNNILAFKLFKDFMTEYGITIKGIITTKESSSIQEIQVLK
ncbi:hypothetical protein [Emticicia sp. 17c]|uniref:hypothetical protein n=1 Tax=Emticicia sp. 17c TaxID=3127704 RepID=UPI00301C33C9